MVRRLVRAAACGDRERANVSYGPPRGRGCGPRSSDELQSFVSDADPCLSARWHDSVCSRFAACCSPTADCSSEFIFGGCGGRALREPPKIAPRSGAFANENMWNYVSGFGYLVTVRRRRSECDSSPPQWGGGELRDSKESHFFSFAISASRPLQGSLICHNSNIFGG